MKYLLFLTFALLTSCNSIGIMLGTRAYYPKIKDVSYQERSKNGQSWVRIKKTRTDSSIYIRNPELIGFTSSGFATQTLDSLMQKYQLLVDGYYDGITLLKKKDGSSFDKYNLPVLRELRNNNNVFYAGAVATIDSKKKIFLNKIYLYLKKECSYQKLNKLIEKYNLIKSRTSNINGLRVQEVLQENNIGEGIVELAMELQRNPNIKHAIVETNPSPSNPLSE